METQVKVKHTPGPWEAATELRRNWMVRTVESCISSGKEDDDGKTHNDMQQHLAENIGMADAFLISAAPELLQACRMAQSFSNYLPTQVVHAIESAIAKAEGNQ